jgi:hypothetical protein
MSKFETPILYLIFNRPDLVAITFQQIREVKPSRLFIAADGPRHDRPDDLEKCNQTRNIVLSMVDWKCEVRTLLRDENLGCGLAVSSAITWFFDQVEEGIILEDDCLPIPFFFQYCQTLLKKFRNNGHIMHISGNNFITSMKTPYDIIFSKYPHSWGWASWKNRWSFYTFDLMDADKNFNLQQYFFLNSKSRKYWLDVFEKTKSGIINTWDYQWFHAIWRNDGICIIPKYNLVTNIGFHNNATHTKEEDSRFNTLITRKFILDHYPPNENIDMAFDEKFFRIYLKKQFNLKVFFKKIAGI